MHPALRRAALEHEAAVAIAAVDVALLVDLHPHARMAERGRAVVLAAADVAGEPVSCITPNRSRNLQVIEHVGVVYDDGDTIYVARPSNPRSLGSMDVPVIERFGSQLCKQDLTKTIDRYDGHVSGVVFLSDFVPYTKSDNG